MTSFATGDIVLHGISIAIGKTGATMKKRAVKKLAKKSNILTPDQMRSETPVLLKNARNLFPVPASMSEMYNWRQRGAISISGGKFYLEWYRQGGKVYTTVEAVKRFVDAINR